MYIEHSCSLLAIRGPRKVMSSYVQGTYRLHIEHSCSLLAILVPRKVMSSHVQGTYRVYIEHSCSLLAILVPQKVMSSHVQGTYRVYIEHSCSLLSDDIYFVLSDQAPKQACLLSGQSNVRTRSLGNGDTKVRFLFSRAMAQAAYAVRAEKHQWVTPPGWRAGQEPNPLGTPRRACQSAKRASAVAYGVKRRLLWL